MIGCNLLATWPPSLVTTDPYDLVLLSNLMHCQGWEETTVLLGQAAALTKPQGQVLVHDFFSDDSPFGALYDLHMLLNTYNGRTYSGGELEKMARSQGLMMASRRQLPSGSALVTMHPACTSRECEE